MFCLSGKTIFEYVKQKFQVCQISLSSNILAPTGKDKKILRFQREIKSISCVIRSMYRQDIRKVFVSKTIPIPVYTFSGKFGFEQKCSRTCGNSRLNDSLMSKLLFGKQHVFINRVSQDYCLCRYKTYHNLTCLAMQKKIELSLYKS